MAVATGDSKAAVEASLDDAVDALLAQIDTACLQTEQQLQENDPPAHVEPEVEAEVEVEAGPEAVAGGDAATDDGGIAPSATAAEMIPEPTAAAPIAETTEPAAAAAPEGEVTLDVATSAMLEDAAQHTEIAADFPQVEHETDNAPLAAADTAGSPASGPEAADERELSPVAVAAADVAPQAATATLNVAAGPNDVPISAESIQALDAKLAVNAALVADDAFSDGADDLGQPAPAAEAPAAAATGAPAPHDEPTEPEVANPQAEIAQAETVEAVAAGPVIPAAAAPVPAPIPVAAAAPPAPAPVPVPAPVASAAKPVASAPVPALAPAPAAPQHATSQAAPAAAPAPVIQVPRKPILAPLLARVSGAALKVVGPVIRPLLITNPKTRQTIAWVGTVTLFNAALIWSYALLKGPPEPGIPIGPQPTLHGMEEHPESKKIRAKAAEEAAKTAAIAAAAPPAAAAKDDGQGGGEKKSSGGH